LELIALRRPLADEDAGGVVAGVAAGDITPWLLGWVPLMRGGGESGKMEPWRAAAESLLSDARDRADLGMVTVTFATLAGCREAWDRGLQGWNMQTSPFWDEIRAQGRAEGRAEGQVEGKRATVLHVGRHKFGRAPTRKQQKTLEAITDLGLLDRLAERLLEVDTWAELLADVP
jgi:hypothetical protein